MFRCASARTLESFFGKKKERSRDARYHVSQQAHRIARPVGPKFPLPGGQSPEWWWMSYHGGGSLCAGFAVERSARTKIATIVTGGTWTCSVSGAIFATRSGEWFVGVVAWSKKRCLGRQGEPLYQELRTRGSVAGTEDGRQRRSELFPSDVAFGATDHQRVVAEQRDERRELDGLRVIGMDEISYRKRHKYLTVVIDHLSGRVVWAGKERKAKTLLRFFPASSDHKEPRSSKRSAWTCGSRT